jgi:hypothetical protein
MSVESPRWTLSNGTTNLVCVSRSLVSGSELLVIYCDGLPLRNQVCTSEAEAYRWADEHRVRWEAVGWRAPTRAAAECAA